MRKKKELKKKLEDFIKDESGSISRDKVLKIGLGTISALGIMSAFSSEAAAGHTSNSTHPPIYNSDDHPGCDHVSHSSHSSY